MHPWWQRRTKLDRRECNVIRPLSRRFRHKEKTPYTTALPLSSPSIFVAYPIYVGRVVYGSAMTERRRSVTLQGWRSTLWFAERLLLAFYSYEDIVIATLSCLNTSSCTGQRLLWFDGLSFSVVQQLYYNTFPYDVVYWHVSTLYLQTLFISLTPPNSLSPSLSLLSVCIAVFLSAFLQYWYDRVG